MRGIRHRHRRLRQALLILTPCVRPIKRYWTGFGCRGSWRRGKANRRNPSIFRMGPAECVTRGGQRGACRVAARARGYLFGTVPSRALHHMWYSPQSGPPDVVFARLHARIG